MIQTRPLDLSPGGLAECAGLIRTAMPRTTYATEAFLDWQYNRNPAGKALGWNAFEGETLISHCAVQPLRARLFGSSVRGVMSLNAVSHPEFRKKGLYFELVNKTYDRAREDGYAFGVAVTNDASTPGFVRDVGFQLVSPLGARLGVGPMPRPRGTIGLDLEHEWEPKSLAWRMSPPHKGYRLVASGDRYSVRGPAPYAGIEVVMGEVEGEVGRELDAELSRDGGRDTTSSLTLARLWIGLDARVRWVPSLYVNLPMRLRPSPLNLIFLDLTGAGRRLEPARVRWSALDFDTF
jgi:GNAT superfamily N-acetyltransferase